MTELITTAIAWIGDHFVLSLLIVAVVGVAIGLLLPANHE